MLYVDRDIDKLWDKPRSELTDEELDKLIEYKALQKASENAFAERAKAEAEALQAMADAQAALAEEVRGRLDAMLDASRVAERASRAVMAREP